MDINRIFNRGKEFGIEEMEIYMKKSSSTGFKIYGGSMESYNIEEENVLSIRGTYNGRMGYSYTEKLEEESIDEVLNNLIQYAENNESDYIEKLALMEGKYETKEKEGNNLDKYTDEEKIDFLKAMEREALAFDKIKAVENCSYKEITNSIFITNTKGLKLEDSHRIGIINLSVVAENEGDMQPGYSFMVVDDILDEYKDILIKGAVSDALGLLGSSTIKSKKCQVILRNNVAADIFSSMAKVFNGDIVQRNLSMMKDKIGEKIAVESLNIVEDPLFEKGLLCRTFDDEGTPTPKKHIIEKGVLMTFLHNNRTAEKEGVKSTGNGFRTSHKASIEALSTNLYIEKGSTSLDNMIKSIDEGVLIISVEGLHAGINPVSGDFSLLSSGYLIEAGKITKPLCQITVAGNFYGMIEDISDIGNDLKFSFPDIGNFGSPSLKIKSLTIAGN